MTLRIERSVRQGTLVFTLSGHMKAEEVTEFGDILSGNKVHNGANVMAVDRESGTLWVSSSSSAGGTPPYLAPYFASKAGMDAMAIQYARELALWGIETSIIVPGAFTGGTSHFAHSGTPADKERAAEYEAGPYKGYGKKIQEAFAAIVPPDADADSLADAIVKVVDAPFGKRPFRVHIDPTQDGAEVAFAVMDRVRTEMLHRVGLSELLTPAGAESEPKQRLSEGSKVFASMGISGVNDEPNGKHDFYHGWRFGHRARFR
jgi:hypothetical protein